jgi:hypothetical protein
MIPDKHIVAKDRQRSRLSDFRNRGPSAESAMALTEKISRLTAANAAQPGGR